MFLGCEKRLLDPGHGLGRDSAASILDENCELIAIDLSRYRKHPARRHGIPGICRKIEQQLLQVPLSRLDVRNRIAELNLQLNTLPFQAISKNCERAIQRAAHVALSIPLTRVSRQGEHSAEDSPAGLYG